MSLTLSGQKSRIFWYKYHCLSRDSPGEIICSGKLVDVGLHVVDFKRFILRSFRSSLAYHTGMISRKPEVMHLGDAFRSSLNCVSLKKFAPIIHGDMDSAIVLSYQLGMVDNCRPLSHLCYVIDAPHYSFFKQLFKKAKTPVWRKLGVADQQKGQNYLLVEPRRHPPHQVINHEAVFYFVPFSCRHEDGL